MEKYSFFAEKYSNRPARFIKALPRLAATERIESAVSRDT